MREQGGWPGKRLKEPGSGCNGSTRLPRVPSVLWASGGPFVSVVVAPGDSFNACPCAGSWHMFTRWHLYICRLWFFLFYFMFHFEISQIHRKLEELFTLFPLRGNIWQQCSGAQNRAFRLVACVCGSVPFSHVSSCNQHSHWCGMHFPGPRFMQLSLMLPLRSHSACHCPLCALQSQRFSSAPQCPHFG